MDDRFRYAMANTVKEKYAMGATQLQFIQHEKEPEFKDGDDNDGSGIEMIQIIPYDNGWVLNVDVDNEDADDIREVYTHDQKKDLMKRLEELL